MTGSGVDFSNFLTLRTKRPCVHADVLPLHLFMLCGLAHAWPKGGCLPDGNNIRQEQYAISDLIRSFARCYRIGNSPCRNTAGDTAPLHQAAYTFCAPSVQAALTRVGL